MQYQFLTLMRGLKNHNLKFKVMKKMKEKSKKNVISFIAISAIIVLTTVFSLSAKATGGDGGYDQGTCYTYCYPNINYACIITNTGTGQQFYCPGRHSRP